MSEAEVESFAELPKDLAPASVVRFFPEYACEHPLWLDDGELELDSLQLPSALVDRLRRWSAYWNDTFHWDDGWPTGTPALWWTAEEDALPHDLATALGHDFTIRVEHRYLRSTSPAQAPQAAAALAALQRAAKAEADRIARLIANGATFTARSGESSYAEWLAQSPSEAPPAPDPRRAKSMTSEDDAADRREQLEARTEAASRWLDANLQHLIRTSREEALARIQAAGLRTKVEPADGWTSQEFGRDRITLRVDEHDQVVSVHVG